MMGRGNNNIKNQADNQKWRSLFKRHDYVRPTTPAELAILEDRIMAQVDALPAYTFPSGFAWRTWALNESWVMRGACLAAVLFALLGFTVGRAFDDLYFQAADSSTLFASADGTLWQSFITAPSSGDTDDTAE